MSDPSDAAGPLPIVLLGGGGHAAVVADALLPARWEPVGYLADEPSEHPPLVARDDSCTALRWLGRPDEALALLEHRLGPRARAIAAVGDAAMRRRWLEAIPEARRATVVAPSAVVSPSARLAGGVFVGPHAVVNARAVVGTGAIVNSAAVVEHDCHVGAFAHLAPNAALGGAAAMGDDSFVGLGASVLPGVRVGRGAVLGAGAVATEDVPENATAAGVPARVLRATAG